MVSIYADLVMAGERSLDGESSLIVPEKYHSAVIKELKIRGYLKSN